MAESYLKAKQYKNALDFYEKAWEKQGTYNEKATQRKSLVSNIIKVAPFSEQGANIALDNSIDRADLCALLVDELQIKSLLKRFRREVFETLYNENFSLIKRRGNIPSDVTDHQSKKWIYDIIPLHISGIEVFPNGFFYPDKLITRVQLAVVMQEIMVLVTDNPGLSTAYSGTESQFPDVRTDYYAFNAITLCVEKGIMDANPQTGVFNSDKTVSGAEAILVIRSLERIVEK